MLMAILYGLSDTPSLGVSAADTLFVAWHWLVSARVSNSVAESCNTPANSLSAILAHSVLSHLVARRVSACDHRQSLSPCGC